MFKLSYQKLIVLTCLKILPNLIVTLTIQMNIFDFKSIRVTVAHKNNVYPFRSIRPQPNNVPEIVFSSQHCTGKHWVRGNNQPKVAGVKLGSKSGQILFWGQAGWGSGNMNPSCWKVFPAVSMMSGVSDLDIFSLKKYFSLKMIWYDEWLFDLDIFSKKP